MLLFYASSGLISNNVLTFPQFTKLQRCGLWDAILDGNRSRKRIKNNAHQYISSTKLESFRSNIDEPGHNDSSLCSSSPRASDIL